MVVPARDGLCHASVFIAPSCAAPFSGSLDVAFAKACSWCWGWGIFKTWKDGFRSEIYRHFRHILLFCTFIHQPNHFLQDETPLNPLRGLISGLGL